MLTIVSGDSEFSAALVVDEDDNVEIVAAVAGEETEVDAVNDGDEDVDVTFRKGAPIDVNRRV